MSACTARAWQRSITGLTIFPVPIPAFRLIWTTWSTARSAPFCRSSTSARMTHTISSTLRAASRSRSPCAAVRWNRGRHGDIHGQNCHLCRSAPDLLRLRLLRSGLAGYDLATFRWNAKLSGMDDTTWTVFLEGYTSRRHDQRQRTPGGRPAVRSHAAYLAVGARRRERDDWGYGGLDAASDWGLMFLGELGSRASSVTASAAERSGCAEPAVSEGRSVHPTGAQTGRGAPQRRRCRPHVKTASDPPGSGE